MNVILRHPLPYTQTSAASSSAIHRLQLIEPAERSFLFETGVMWCGGRTFHPVLIGQQARTVPECDPLWLENQICFALYAAANANTRSYRVPFEELGLTSPQYLVIASFLEKPSMTSGELARAPKLGAGTLTPMLKRLARSGLIQRTQRIDEE